MTPYEYLCEQILMRRIKAHIYEQFDRNYRDSYGDVMKGLHNDLKNMIVGQKFDNGAMNQVTDAISQAIYRYVKDGNILVYNEDKQAFLEQLGVGKDFNLPLNVDSIADFYDSLIANVINMMYSTYLRVNKMNFEYMLKYKGEDNGLSNRYEIELKKW